MQNSGLKVQGSGSRVQGPGFRVQESGFMVQVSGRSPEELGGEGEARPDLVLDHVLPTRRV